MNEPTLKLPLHTERTLIIDDNGYPVSTGEGVTDAVRVRRAREIVHRCNTWDALLAACKIARAITGETARDSIHDRGKEIISAAIADAEKEIL